MLCVLSCSVLSCVVLVVLGVVWHHFGSSWGSFWDILGRLGGRFGPLEASWGALGAVLGGLGALLGAVDEPKILNPTCGKFTGGQVSIFSSNLASQKGAKTTPRRPEIDQKIVLKNDRVLERS